MMRPHSTLLRLATLGFALIAGGAAQAQPLSFATNYPLSGSGVLVRAADMNRDGLLDLVLFVNSGGSLSFQVALNSLSAPGNFSAGPPVPFVGSSIRGAVVLFADGDLLPDVMVANNNTLLAFTANGLGGFTANGSLYLGSSVISGLVAADFDGDGLEDVIASRGSNIRILRNSTLGFIDLGDTSGVGSLSNIRCAQICGSSLPDLVGVLSSGVVRYTNNGGMSFTAATAASGISGAVAVGTGDRDGDGDTDLIVGTDNGTSAATLLDGNGVCGFTAIPISGVGGSGNVPEFARMDNDAIPDLVVSHLDQSSVSVLRGTPTGTYVLGPTVGVGLNPNHVAVADLDADGDLDIVTANLGGSYSVILNQSPPAPCATTLTLNLLHNPGTGPLTIQNLCGPAHAPYFTAISFSSANGGAGIGQGWWFGLHIDLNTLLAELAFAAPFRGNLSSSGGSTFTIPSLSPALVGITCAGVSLAFNPTFTDVVAISPPVAIVL